MMQAYRRFRSALGPAAYRANRIHFRLESSAVALTFDDGPDPVHTPRVLDRLSELGVRATFFLVGSEAQAQPEIVHRMLAEGHTVGSHSLTHRDARHLSLPALARDYRLGRRAVEEVVGKRVTLFRPPKGHLDAKGFAAVNLARVQTWMWSHDPADWNPQVPSSRIVDLADELEPGAVVLLHDGAKLPVSEAARDRSGTVDALEPLVRRVRARGLEFAPIPARGQSR